MSEIENRIYVVVAQTVDTPNGVVVQPCGRVAAQCAHVVSKARDEIRNKTGALWAPITTIILAARDSKELQHVSRLLFRNHIAYSWFLDTNGPVYGEGNSVCTAICTWPIDVTQLEDITDYLPLWSHSVDV